MEGGQKVAVSAAYHHQSKKSREKARPSRAEIAETFIVRLNVFQTVLALIYTLLSL